jgi:predicted nucleotidyltransferase
MEPIIELCRLYKVRELAVFGSVPRDSFHSDSDVDLLVEFDKEAQVGFMTLARLERELSMLLERGVDLIPKGGLKPGIRETILAEARILYAA